MKFTYTYHGDHDVYLSEHGITTDISQKDKTYSSDKEINHPHFHVVGGEQPKQEKPKQETKKDEPKGKAENI